MPRPLRIEYEGAWYHVMNRGAAYQDIYKNDQQRLIFLNLLCEASLYYNIEIHTFCLMDNHYHLLIHTPQGNLSQAMRHINGIYTQAFNRLENIDGSLFRGRYKSILVENDAYLLHVSRYIHLNPVTAGMTQRPENYKWSSYQHFIGKKAFFPWLHTSFLTEMIGHSKKQYQLFVNEGLDESTKVFYESKKHPAIFGGKQFKNHALNKIPMEKLKKSSPDYNRTRELPSISQISKACSQYFKIREEILLNSQLGKDNPPRRLAMYFCRVIGQAKLGDIAIYFNCKTKSGPSNAINKVKYNIQTSSSLKKQKMQLEKILLSTGQIESERGQVFP